MSYWLLMAAGLIALASMVFHGVVGGRIYGGNVNRSDMENLTKSLSLVSWHVFTIFLLVCGVTLIYIAYEPSLALAIYPLIWINALGAGLFIYLGIRGHAQLLRMPGAYLMAATALLAWLAIG